MIRTSRKIIPFRRPLPRVVLSRHADHSHIQLNFHRQHTGDAPDPLAVRLSWLQIIARGLALIFIVAIAFMMAGCAHDNYSPASGTGSKDETASAVRSCKREVMHSYEVSQPVNSGAIVGAVLGGLMGGMLGGAIGGGAGAAADQSSGGDRYSNIDQDMERCMADKGYVGTSDDNH